jgi:hypothetical protein
MTTQNSDERLWLMLGEIRGDLKYLVEARGHTDKRLKDLESDTGQQLEGHEKRLRSLENFRLRIGTLTTALGVAVPTSITVIAHKLGLL